MYRMLDCGTWDDPWFAELDPDAKLLFLYLITNRRSTSCGAFEITIRAMAFETGLSSERVTRLLDEYGERVRWWPDHQIVWLRNFYKHQAYNEKTKVNARRIVADLPEVIREIIAEAYPDFVPDDDTHQIPLNRGMHITTASASASEEQQHQKNNSNSNLEPARDEPPPSGAATYADVLDGSLPKLLSMFLSVDQQFTDGWVRTILVEAESQVGPLPRDKLGKGLTLAVDQIKRQLENGKVGSPRRYARKLIVDYLMEQKHGRPAA